MHDPSNESQLWWSSRRKRYNIGLIISGMVAFAGYLAVLSIFQRDDRLTHVEITLFTILFQGIGYLVMMLIANLFYNLGPLAESLCDPSRPEAFRTILFNLGFWFSVALPLLVPGFLLVILFTVPVID